MTFDFDMSKPPQGTEKREFEPIADGDYTGTIVKSEVATTKAGLKNITLQIKLSSNRVVFDRLNFEAANPTAKEITSKKFQSIVYFGIEKPQAKFQTLEQMASYLNNVPVKLYHKTKGKDANGYDQTSITYKPTDAKITKGTAPAKAVY